MTEIGQERSLRESTMSCKPLRRKAMRYAITVLALWSCAAVVSSVFADGLPLTGGRIRHGQGTVFTLTPEQERFIACAREHQIDNYSTPYVFRLTYEQAGQLRKEAGVSPTRFQVYETYRGENDTGPHWNLALRFSEHQIEIPHKLLLSDPEARQAEFEVIGWIHNNYVEVTCKSRASGSAHEVVESDK